MGQGISTPLLTSFAASFMAQEVGSIRNLISLGPSELFQDLSSMLSPRQRSTSLGTQLPVMGLPRKWLGSDSVRPNSW